MGVEIERKFLVTGDGWRSGSDGGTSIRQGFLSTDKERVVRVRLEERPDGSPRGTLTVKGLGVGASRPEFEWAISPGEARELLDALCLRPLIEKVRHRVDHAGHTWEIDIFGGRNRGLVVAEVELAAEDAVVALPPWVGDEVTRDPRYANARLAEAPYDTW